MIEQFAAVAAELELWREQGLVLPVWWRDDDAIEPSPALDRLLALSARCEAPLHLAVIPEPATQELAARLSRATNVSVLPHGWQHSNHAPPDQKKAEFGPHRPVAEMLEDIGRGWRRIRGLFGAQALPIFTPPWNRIAPDVVAGLPGTGIQGLSTFGRRKAGFAAAGISQVNTHIDPVAWHAGGGLVATGQLCSHIAEELQARRQGLADNAEPLGLLTHHLVQDEATWSFTAMWLELLRGSAVAKWVPPVGQRPDA